jgi:hypothetical protein
MAGIRRFVAESVRGEDEWLRIRTDRELLPMLARLGT